MLSLWSAVNPGVWVSPGPALQGGSFTIAANATLDNKTSTPNQFRALPLVLMTYSRPHAFLELADGVLGFFGDGNARGPELLLPGIQRS